MRRIFSFAAGLALSLGAAALMVGSSPATANAVTSCDVADYSNDAEELAFLGIINNYRVANGAGELTLSSSLNRAASWMVADMGKNAYFGHTDSLGRDPWTRIVDCGYPVAGGENLAAGTYRNTAASAFELFQGSPSHNENMLLARYTEIGIARLFVPGSQYGWYWATTFGTEHEAPAPAPTAPPPTAAPPPTETPAPAPVVPVAAAPAPVQPTPTPDEPAPIVIPPSSLELHAGVNLVTWTGGETRLSDLVKDANGSISMIYRWDAGHARWLRYAPGMPWFIQSFQAIAPGDSVWVIAGASAQLSPAR